MTHDRPETNARASLNRSPSASESSQDSSSGRVTLATAILLLLASLTAVAQIAGYRMTLWTESGLVANPNLPHIALRVRQIGAIVSLIVLIASIPQWRVTTGIAAISMSAFALLLFLV